MNTFEKRVTKYVEENKTKLFSLLTQLIKFDTQNFISFGREKKCQYYIADLYKALGLEVQVYTPDSIPDIQNHPGYQPGRGTDKRPNVTGICYGAGENKRVMIASHTDTMPVGERNKWKHDPFGGIMENGRIYGLGAGDNKFGIAGSYFALKALKDCGIKLKSTVLLTAYVDEEYGGGNGALGACLKYPCETYVNLDGGNYEIWVCALGGGGFEIEVRSDKITDTASPTVNALYSVKSEIELMGYTRREELENNPYYLDSNVKHSAFRLMDFSVGSFGTNLNSGKLQFVIYTDKSEECIYNELNAIESSINKVLKGTGYYTTGFKPTTRFFEYIEADTENPAIKIITETAEETRGVSVKKCGACLSDLSIFLSYGSKSSFSFGIFRDFSLPGGAHQPDEYIECQQFVEHTKALALFLIRYCGVIK